MNMKIMKYDEEVIITGKQLREHRDICREEGKKVAYKEILLRIRSLKESVGAMPLDKYLKQQVKRKVK